MARHGGESKRNIEQKEEIEEEEAEPEEEGEEGKEEEEGEEEGVEDEKEEEGEEGFATYHSNGLCVFSCVFCLFGAVTYFFGGYVQVDGEGRREGITGRRGGGSTACCPQHNELQLLWVAETPYDGSSPINNESNSSR